MTLYREFIMITKDILDHPEFQKTKEIIHHGKDNNVYTHSVSTAIFAYRVAKRFKLSETDISSITRAALLHDFVGYDWRDGKPDNICYKGFKRIWHTHIFQHGFSAAENASGYFDLSKKQTDAIKKHMFPLVPMIPRYKEGWIITYSDKMVASREMTLAVIDSIRTLFRKCRMAMV